MKEITYKERANFYFEETFSDLDHCFLKKIMQVYSIKSVLDIPCGAGRNLDILANNSNEALFCDIEIEMINQVKKRILSNNYSNCRAFNGDIFNYNLDEKVDMTIIMRQALQLFEPEKIKYIIDNVIKNTSKILVIDLYSFSHKNAVGQIPEYLKDKTKVFRFNNQTIVRKTELKDFSKRILVKNIYCAGNEKWNTQFKLFDINIEFVRKILHEKNVKNIYTYMDYFGHFRTDENSAILVVELK